MGHRLGAFNFTPDISFTEEMSRVAYVIVVNDPTEQYGHAIPDMPEVARILYNTSVYTSYLDAKKGLMQVIEKFDNFIPVAYGDAYPYESTTFEREITEKDYARIGWVVVEGEDDEDSTPVHIPIGLHKVFIQDSQQVS
jgi:hypothetical protein